MNEETFNANFFFVWFIWKWLEENAGEKSNALDLSCIHDLARRNEVKESINKTKTIQIKMILVKEAKLIYQDSWRLAASEKQEDEEKQEEVEEMFEIEVEVEEEEKGGKERERLR